MNAPLSAPVAPAAPAADRAAQSRTPLRYEFASLSGAENSDELLVLLAFSGGGKRSSAFSYGVLKAVKATKIGVGSERRSLLYEVDLISSVSGGTFPAAYYALHRDRIFTDFEKDFLRQDIDAYIFGLYLLPWHWEWMVNPLWGTNDTMMQVYDDLMFHGATYSDLIKNGKPLIAIGATDIGTGSAFAFTQRQFELICSDLASFPVSRAVAASNGFPVLFTPITLESHRENCPEGRPGWLPAMPQILPEDATRIDYIARDYERYLDPRKIRYVHLMDGGIADNLALRSLLNAMLIFDASDQFLAESVWLKLRRILIVSVDGEAATDTSWNQQRIVTGLAQVFSAVSGTQIDRYNFETLMLARQTVASFVDRLKRLRCVRSPKIDGHDCDDVRGFFGHVALSDIVDEATRERLESIPTGLTIDEKDVDLLVQSGEAAIKGSKAFQSFIESASEP